MRTLDVPGFVESDTWSRGYRSHKVFAVSAGILRREYFVLLEKRRTHPSEQITFVLERRGFLTGRKHRVQPPELWKGTWVRWADARQALQDYERNRYGNRKIIRLWNLFRRR